MNLSPKKSTHHLKCVVCNKGFSSHYDEKSKTFPIFHTKHDNPGMECEDVFYKVLMGIYNHLLKSEYSLPANKIVQDVKALDRIVQKKDMLAWSLSMGYLIVDGFGRIDIPEVIMNELQGVFSEEAMHNLDERPGAVEWIKAKLSNLKDELHPVSPDKMPFKKGELNLGESTIYGKMDTSGVELRKDKKSDNDDSSRTSSLRSMMDRKNRR